VRLCYRRGVFFGQFFFTFFFDFQSQIYTSPPPSVYHAPPSHVPRRLPPLTLQDPVISVVDDRRVAPTRLDALCSVVRVRATLRLFLAVLDGIGFYGVGSLSGWPRRRRVSFTRHRPVCRLFPHWRQFDLDVFLPLCFGVFSFCFSGLSLLVVGSNFMGLFVGKVLDLPSFFRE
jgi:hypothetical protein